MLNRSARPTLWDNMPRREAGMENRLSTPLQREPGPAVVGPEFDAIRAAHRRIAPHVHRTPVMTSASLDDLAGAQLYFKCENLQRSGSFKMRGASNAVFSLSKEEAARGVLTHSSGNHAAALALAARRRGIRAWIVMPSDAAQIKRAAVAAFGGEITLCEPTLAAREATAAEVLRRTGAVLVHPYDDDRIIAGQATAAVELIEEVPDLDFVLAPVSGGGLLSGTGIATKHLLPAARVIGCVPRTADAIALVSEEEIVAAMRLLWERLKVVVEPSGAVAAAPAIFRQIHAEGRKVGIILS